MVIKARITVVTLRGAVELREWLNRMLLLRSIRVKISQQHVGIDFAILYVTVAYAAVKLGSQTMTKCHLINDSTVEDKEVSQQKKIACFSQC